MPQKLLQLCDTPYPPERFPKPLRDSAKTFLQHIAKHAKSSLQTPLFKPFIEALIATFFTKSFSECHSVWI
jgi:hypothetical protein